MKRKPSPWSRHHEFWCAIFRGKPCDCDDDSRPSRIVRRPRSGSDTPAPRREREEVDA